MSSLLERVKEENPLRNKIEEYSQPREENGKIAKYYCPLHDDKDDPSLAYYKDQDTAYCYGCGKYVGNAVDFVKFMEGIDFKEALHQVAVDSNISIDDDSKKEYNRNKKIRKRLEELTNEFKSNLYNNKKILRYLMKERRLTKDTIKEFELGYCTNKEKKSLRKFNNRITLPIKDKYGRYLALAGRIVPSEESNRAKYMNSGKDEIPFFRKEEVIFNFNRAKQYINKKGYVVWTEGYFDVMLPYQYGVKNIVASMGTAVTDKQIYEMSKITDTVYMFLDPDDSGKEALIKSLEKFDEYDIVLKVVNNGHADKDPADLALIYKNNLDDYIEKNVVTVEQFFTEEILSKYNKKVIDAKREAVNKLSFIFKDRLNKPETQFVLENVASQLDLSSSSFLYNKLKGDKDEK